MIDTKDIQRSPSNEQPFRQRTLTRRQLLKIGAVIGGATLTPACIDWFNAPGQQAGPTPAVSLPETPLHQPTPDQKLLFEPKTIDGLETYGSDQPLSYERLVRLYGQLNEEEREIREDTYYGTLFISDSGYKNFSSYTDGENIQSFLKRHENHMNGMLESAAGPKGLTRFNVRRLIVLENSVPKHKLPFSFPYIRPISAIEEELRDFLKDSDGAWTLFDDVILPNRVGVIERRDYNPNNSAYYTGKIQDNVPHVKNIDFGLLHEMGHTILHLPDQYGLDFNERDQVPDEFSHIPIAWRYYSAEERPDISQGELMIGGGYIEEYSQFLLWRRLKRGIVHDRIKTVPEMLRFPNEIPQIVTLNFGKDTGGAEVKFYRTQPINVVNNLRNPRDARTLERIDYPVHNLSEEGVITVDRASFFGSQKGDFLDPNGRLTFFIEITTKEGKKFYRWMDIRDFNIAYWFGTYFLGSGEHVVMNMRAASENDLPRNFNWLIQTTSPKDQ